MGFEYCKYRPYTKRNLNLANSGGSVRLQESQYLSSSKYFHTNIEINRWEIFCEDNEESLFKKMAECKEIFDAYIRHSAKNLKSKYVKERRIGEKQRKDADDYLKAFKILHKRLKQHKSGNA